MIFLILHNTMKKDAANIAGESQEPSYFWNGQRDIASYSSNLAARDTIYRKV